MQALNEGTIGAVRAQGTRYDGESIRGSQGRLPGRRRPLVSLLTKVRCRSLMSVRTEGLRWKMPSSLSYLCAQVQGISI